MKNANSIGVELTRMAKKIPQNKCHFIFYSELANFYNHDEPKLFSLYEHASIYSPG